MSTSRRFLLASSLARLIQKERGGERMIEGYFPEQADRSSSVRIEGSAGFLVLISRGPGGDTMERAEVPRTHAEALLDVAAGEVDYVRTRLSIGSREIQIDRFIRPGPLDVISVEFEREEDAREFYPLPWFGPEVTADPSYRGRQIALMGLPETFEMPLQDAALNSLLDTLENRFPASRPRPRPAGTASAASRRPEQQPQEEPRAAANFEPEEADPEESLIRELARTLRPQRR